MKQTPTGVTDRAVLARLMSGDFYGSIPDLAEEIHCRPEFVWLAVAGLATREQIHAHRNSIGLVRLQITRAGHKTHAENQRKYAPTKRERRQGRVSFA